MRKTIVIPSDNHHFAPGEVRTLATLPPFTTIFYFHADLFGNLEIEIEIPDDGTDIIVEPRLKLE